jgi:hypothetical protein
VRRWRKRLDNPEVKQARLLVERLRAEPFDVLHLGASESIFVAPEDVDTRPLPAMYADALAPELSTYVIAGTAYNTKLYKAYLDILATYPLRPIVVMMIGIRLGFYPWSEHPEYLYDRSLTALRKIDPHSPPWRFRAVVPLANDAEFARMDTIEYPTMVGTRTIGEFRRVLKNPKTSGLTHEEHVRTMYAFQHGATHPMAESFLREMTEVGVRLRELDLPLVVFHAPVPVVRGCQLLGEELLTRTLENQAIMESAFKDGFGPIDILQTGASLDVSEFLDPDDATEHMNERGRQHIADMIVGAVHQLRAGATTPPA